MLATISKLKKSKHFTVTELTGVTITSEGRSGGKVYAQYDFYYDEVENTLYVSGDVFGTQSYEVINKGQVLFQIAKGAGFKAEITGDYGDNIEFNVHIFNLAITE